MGERSWEGWSHTLKGPSGRPFGVKLPGLCAGWVLKSDSRYPEPVALQRRQGSAARFKGASRESALLDGGVTDQVRAGNESEMLNDSIAGLNDARHERRVGSLDPEHSFGPGERLLRWPMP